MSPARDDQGDRELFRQLTSGRREALAALYDRHAASLYRHALAISRRTVDAEDLVHAVFVKLATTGAELLGVRQPASYLHRMLHTSWLDSQRRAIVDEKAIQQIGTAVPDVQPAIGASIDLTRALDLLPPAQRQAIVLHLVEGFSFREVGRLTGVSLFTAAARYRLALARLRRALGATQ